MNQTAPHRFRPGVKDVSKKNDVKKKSAHTTTETE